MSQGSGSAHASGSMPQREAGIAERAGDGFRLTGDGRRLLEAFAPLDAWATRWARREG
jgi:hypothetical protein